MKMAPCLIALALAGMGCGGAQERPAPGRPAPVTSFDDDLSGVSQAAGPPSSPASAAPPAKNQDGPHISRSVGEPGGLVVFWPRIIPKTDDANIQGYARALQQRLVAIANKKFKGKIDVRPAPERVCPQQGCKAATLGVLFTHRGGGCTAVALFSRPGRSPIRLIPWAGVVTLKKDQVPFRAYPETQLSIQDAVPCADFVEALAQKQADVEAAL